MRPQLSALLATLALATAAPGVPAQEYAVARRTFTFFGRGLAIEVTADGAGALQVVRGEPGRIEVAAHSDFGLSSFALGGYYGDRLRLNALGAGDASYIVVVPERVHVVVTLPGHRFPTTAPDQGGVLRWRGEPAATPAAVAPGPSLVTPDADGLFLVHAAAAAPAQLVLRQARLRRLQVRIGGDRFQVRSNEPLTLREGAGSALRVHTGEHPIALLVTIPAATGAFRLLADDDVLLTIAGGQASTSCQRAVTVRTPAGGRQFEFVPLDGMVRC